MFDFIRHVMRNKAFTVKKARRSWAVRKAINSFRKVHKTCAWCGRSKRLDVHHIIPVSVQPDIAGDENNMIMLCRKPQCHLQVGHNGNYAQRYVENVRELCDVNQVVRTNKSV